jgi:PBSX family phage terminase large subunit
MDMTPLLSPKQLEFVANCTCKWNITHGSVRSGKTVATTFAFMQAVNECPDSKIYIVGHTSETAYRNVITLILNSKEMAIFRPFCTWSNRKLRFKDKTITVLGAKDEGAIQNFQGDTYSLVLCDEMTLYPESIIDMIDTRLSPSHSRGFASMNPSYPSHKIKKWIDKAIAGDKNYYELHFTLDDNPFVDLDYKQRIKNSLSGLFYKRNYLGMWCLAEGSIFDFFDHSIYVCSRPPAGADYWIAGIDYGAVNPFACILVGVSTGMRTQTGKVMWVEKEYYWDPKVQGRQKTNSEFARDIQEFLEPYDVKQLYMDPSAASFRLELQRLGVHVVNANNDVEDGIRIMTSEMKKGNLFVMDECVNLIKEIEGYVWDSKAAEKGEDKPIKKNDHAIDALRYAVASHKVNTYDPYKEKEQADTFLRNRYEPTRRT